jgi:hypothetical protein
MYRPRLAAGLAALVLSAFAAAIAALVLSACAAEPASPLHMADMLSDGIMAQFPGAFSR